MERTSLTHLLGRVNCVARRVEHLVDARRAADPRPLDRLRGLHLPLADLPSLASPVDPGPRPDPAAAELARVESEADRAEAAGADLRLRRLARTLALDPVAVEVLLVALAPDLDRRFEPLYGFLHDDVSRRRASVGLALELSGAGTLDPAARALLRPGSPLVDTGAVVVEDAGRPALSRSLTVADRVVQHLLGDDAAHPLVRAATPSPTPWLTGDPDAVVRAMTRTRLCYLQDPRGSGTAVGLGHEALRQLGREPVRVDLERVPQQETGTVLRAALLEAQLAAAGLLVGPVEVLAERGPDAVRALAELAWPVVVHGSAAWDPAWATTVPVVVTVPSAGRASRGRVWRAVLDGAFPDDLDPVASTSAFDLAPLQVARAATSAWLQAGLAGREVDADALRAGARAQNGSAFERLARRIEPRAGWGDLVLPEPSLALLHDLVARVRCRSLVLEEWGGARTGRGSGGVMGLFTGPPGTGKTTAAEVVARELGFDLYTIDLSSVVDKYIGETEKNLERVFDAAERVNAVLLFDEADALFGKRSEVREAKDRYANVETSYLLQRMERFEGIALLATNLSANLDDAFTRRLDAVVSFPRPDEERRLRLWRRVLGSGMPVEDLDLAFCARAFDLSGGEIRNVALTAAYAAADEGGRAVTMTDLVRAVARENRKMGRLCGAADFGAYAELLEDAA